MLERAHKNKGQGARKRIDKWKNEDSTDAHRNEKRVNNGALTHFKVTQGLPKLAKTDKKQANYFKKFQIRR